MKLITSEPGFAVCFTLGLLLISYFFPTVGAVLAFSLIAILCLGTVIDLFK